MRSRLLPPLVFLALAACGRPEAPALEGTAKPVTLSGAQPVGEAATGPVAFLTQRQAVAPLALKVPVALRLRAGEAQRVTLPVPRSTQGLWARVSSSQPTALTVAGTAVAVSRDTVVHFPVEASALALEALHDVELTLSPLAAVDSAGGGFTPEPEAPREVQATTGFTRLDDEAHQGEAADDSTLRLVEVTAHAAEASRVSIGRCAGATSEPLTLEALFDVPAGATLRTTRWLPAGALCLNALTPASVTLTGVGRVRRFAQTALRAVQPVTLLDTSTGAGGWLGKPLADQALELTLHGLTEPEEVSHRVLSLATRGAAPAGAALRVGPCGGEARTFGAHEPVTVLAPAGQRTCVGTSGDVDVTVTLTGLVTPRDEAPGVCAPVPAEPACAATDLLGRLNCVPGLTAERTVTGQEPPGSEAYLLYLTQPVDHARPDGPSFRQKLLLTVRDEAAPVVLHTTGYDLFQYTSDLSRYFPTNELEVEHRFFGDSVPSRDDWSTMTIMQSAADSHRIVEALRPLFRGRWVSTGHSKGGMTALYHRRFYPCDVDASAPYVTPLSLGRQDARYGPWLAELGGPAYAQCRRVFEAFERGVISRRAELGPLLRGSYTRVGSRERALYASTGSGAWGLFQSGMQDDPREGCPAYEPLLQDPDFDAYVESWAQYGEAWSDEYLEQGELDGYSYQTQNELGSPGTHRSHLLEFGPLPTLPDDATYLFGATKAPAFEARAMPDVQRWLSRYGERFVFVYGGSDPWTGGAVTSPGAVDSMKVVVPEASHGVSLGDAPGPEREAAFSRLEGWLRVPRLVTPGSARAPKGVFYKDVMHRYRL